MARKLTTPSVPSMDDQPARSRSGPAPQFMEGVPRPAVPSDKLDELKTLAKRARVLETRIANGNELLGTLRAEANQLLMDQIPQLMDGIGMPSFTVDAEGNEPAFSMIKSPVYSASLSKPKKAGTPDRREEGFAYLEEIGHGDLIKHEVSFLFPINTSQDLIHEFVKLALRLNIAAVRKTNVGTKKKPVWTQKREKLEVPYPTEERSVNTATLTAWLRSQVEKEQFVPDLEKIGGYIGRQVKIKNVKDN